MNKGNSEEINIRQKSFYENKRKNFVTKMWFSLRNGLLHKVRKDIGIEKEIHQLHLDWMGDLSTKKVLDLGCYEGNPLSIHLAKNSSKYIGIDLSAKGISHLKKRIKNIDNAEAYAVDFLSDEFKEKDFDLIYAFGVLHHFKDTKMLINKLNEKLYEGGLVISIDPLQTNIPLKILRFFYRPFQSDRDWEWPFSKKTFYQFSNSFDIIERRGMLGKAKWFFILKLLPISNEKKRKIGIRWHNEDWEQSKNSDSHLFKCMHLTMLMQKKT